MLYLCFALSFLTVGCFCYDSDLFYENKNLSPKNYSVLIAEKNTHKLPYFWKSTGLCPPDPHKDAHKYFLTPDMEQNFFHIGSLPGNGILQVRIHWLLDLIKIRVSPKLEVTYDLKYLDSVIHMLWKNNLRPGFEIMGNPSNYFTDFENVTQVYLWRNMVQMLAERYIKLYGIEYVMEWNFETWNEPDHHDFDNLNFTTQGFLNYYDACSEGLRAADPRLRFGGPGGSCKIPSKGRSPLCWALLSHCSDGKNYFTNETGVRLDFIAFHKKGNGSGLSIFDQEIETIAYIQKNYPKLTSVPIYNDEADPLKNWSLPQWWRADTTYAAMVVKIILDHIQIFIQSTPATLKDVNYSLLSNDNGFLSFVPNQFTQRTLLSRFQVNNTKPKYVEYVRKPVLIAMTLLSKLCPNILYSEVNYYEKKLVDLESDFGVLATECERDINIIFHNVANPGDKTSTADVNIFFNFSHSNFSDAKYMIFELDNVNTNPYLKWKNLGMPAYPTLKEFKSIKNQEEPLAKGPYEFKGSPSKNIHLKILSPGVTLINICKSPNSIQRVQNVRFLQTWNYSLQISWSDEENKCIFTYNIEKSAAENGPFHQLNKRNITLPSYWHSCLKQDDNCSIKGYYRINAVDYWGNNGPFSKPIKF